MKTTCLVFVYAILKPPRRVAGPSQRPPVPFRIQLQQHNICKQVAELPQQFYGNTEISDLSLLYSNHTFSFNSFT